MKEKSLIVKLVEKIKCFLGFHDWTEDTKGVVFCWNCNKLKNGDGEYDW